MTKHRTISLFTGAGGLDYGLEAAGFTTAVAIESNHDACETLKANTAWKVIEKDLGQVASSDILAAGNIKKQEVSLLAGGPPCQPFSKAGQWHSGRPPGLNDARADTVRLFMRVARETLPAAVLLENVPGFAGSNGALGVVEREFDAIRRQTGCRYELSSKILQAADFGVPQRRERFFLVACRDGVTFQFPDATHAEVETESLQSYLTAWDALGDSDPGDEQLEPSGKWAALLPSIPEGCNYQWHTDRGGGLPLFGWRTKYWTFLLKLAKDKPSWSIQAQPGPAAGPFHWKNRRLSVSELCKLQTIPSGTKIRGDLLSRRKQVGNAVPSLLGEILGRSILSQVFGATSVSPRPELLPRRRSGRPPAARTLEVPKEFLTLKGEHAAHPGTGLGPGAKRREQRGIAA